MMMRHYRNTDLTKLYKVSEKAVRNWIEGAKANKNKLELFEHDGKLFVLDSLHNSLILDDLVQEGKKYRNGRSHRTVTPKSNFYDLYTDKQVLDIVNNLDKYQEFPFQYRYVDKAGAHWDSYLKKLYETGRGNILTSTINLLNIDRSALDAMIDKYTDVNIIDLGVGNGLAVKDLVLRIHAIGKLKKYVGIDVSPHLLRVASENIGGWLHHEIPIETHIRDFSKEEFGDLLPSSSRTQGKQESVNLILFLGGTIGNFKQPRRTLEIIRESMGLEDILVTSDKLDSKQARKFFDFNTDNDKAELSLHNRFALEELGIEEGMYDIEQFFDAVKHARFIQVRLKYTTTIRFMIEGKAREVELARDSPILLLRMWEWDDNKLSNMYTEADFRQIRIVCTDDQEYILLVSRVGNGKRWLSSNK